MAVTWSWYVGENTEPGAAGADATTSVDDEWWQRLLKGIPVIVVSAYTAAAAIVLASDSVTTRQLGFLAIVVVGALATIGEFLLVRKLAWNNADRGKRIAARLQVVVGVLAFLGWSYAQADWAVAFNVFNGVLGGLLVIGLGILLYFSEAIKKRLEG